MSRRHNDANVLIMGGRILGVQLAVSITDVWLETDFDGGYHIPRLEKIDVLAKKFWIV
ncbi:MAG: RpiB/LacA/LacB family sugar-phosphate isomerase [Deferribacteraceae bacterium]|nr:RpiB/LacA/LacB family sugar-phosphate isomerase [Deferribacteraceae bacterium]